MPGRQTKTPKRTTRHTPAESPTDNRILKPLSPKTPGWLSGSNAVFKTPGSPSPKQIRTRRSSMYQSKMIGKRFESQSKVTKVDFAADKQRILSPPVAKRTRRSSVYHKTAMRLIDIPLSPESHSSKVASPKGVTTRTRRSSVYHKGSAKLVQITEETAAIKKGRKLPASVKTVTNLNSHDKSISEVTVKQETKPPCPAPKLAKSLPQKRKIQDPVKSPNAKRVKVTSPSIPVMKVKQTTEKVSSPQRKATAKTPKSKTKKTPVRSATGKTPLGTKSSSRSNPLVQGEVISPVEKSTPVSKTQSLKTKIPASKSPAKTQAKKTPVVQGKKGKTPAAKTPVVQGKGKTPAAKTPVIQSKGKTPATKTPVVQSKAKTPAAKTPVVQSKAKTPTAKTPVVQSKAKTPAAKTSVVQSKAKTPAAKTPVVQSKAKTPGAKSVMKSPAKKIEISSPVKDTPVLKAHKQVVMLEQNKNTSTAGKRKLSSEEGDIRSPQASKKYKSAVESGKTTVKRKSVILKSPPGSGKRTPKRLPKTPIVKRKTTPARHAEVMSQKEDIDPVNKGHQEAPFNITLTDEANTSITSQTSNGMNVTYSHSSRCIIL